jgi:hypothetical protein
MTKLFKTLTGFLSPNSFESPRRSRSPGSRRASRRWRPSFEPLEGRAMLSTLTVLNNADSGHGSLRAEIAAAQNGDTIVFAPSLNGQTIALSGGELSITKGVNIEGPGAGELTISGIASVGGTNYFSRVFEVNAGQPVSISGLNIFDGRGGLNGGAILNHTTLTISNCSIENSTAEYGGAIDNSSTGTMIISGSVIYGGSALVGGGIRNLGAMTVSGSKLINNHARSDGGGIDNQGRLNVDASTLSQNSTYGDGGGIYSWVGGAGVTLTACTLSNNSANVGNTDPWGGLEYGGGGLYVSSHTTATLTDCTLASDTAQYGGYGGGIDSLGNTMLTNCTLASNSAGSGGGIYAGYLATTSLLNCTLALNSAGYGGGIYIDYSTHTLSLTNTIVVGEIYGWVTTADHNLVDSGAGSSGGIVNGVNGNIVGVNPMLGPLANNGGPTETMALLVGSPAIGAADNAAAPATDQRGVTRIDVPGEATDIGAFEL